MTKILVCAGLALLIIAYGLIYSYRHKKKNQVTGVKMEFHEVEDKDFKKD